MPEKFEPIIEAGKITSALKSISVVLSGIAIAILSCGYAYMLIIGNVSTGDKNAKAIMDNRIEFKRELQLMKHELKACDNMLEERGDKRYKRGIAFGNKIEDKVENSEKEIDNINKTLYKLLGETSK